MDKKKILPYMITITIFILFVGCTNFIQRMEDKKQRLYELDTMLTPGIMIEQLSKIYVDDKRQF